MSIVKTKISQMRNGGITTVALLKQLFVDFIDL